MRPKTPAYVARRGDSFLFRRRPLVHPALARRGLNTRRHVVVALRTRDAREAARRAARVGVLFEAGSRMALSVEEMEALLRMAIRATASLPDLPPAARVEAEAAIDAEARRAIAGLPNRLGDPAFLDAFGWSEEPAAEDVAEQLRFSIGGHFEAYDDAIRRGESPVPAMEALRARIEGTPRAPERQAKEAARPPRNDQRAAAREGKSRTVRAALRPGDPDGWVAFAGRYIDRRLAGFLCEAPEEAADPAVGERFRGASLGNYQAAVRLWADAMENRPTPDYTPQDAREFLALLARVPAGHGKGRPVPVREAIALADEQERRAMVEIEASGASPGAIEVAKEKARTPRLKLATIERYRGNLTQVFAWAVASGLRPENPFAGVGMSRAPPPLQERQRERQGHQRRQSHRFQPPSP